MAGHYLPILFAYLGARRKEFAGLAVDDIAKDDKGYIIILRTNGIRRLKNVQSQRLLPVPEEMVRLGFIDYYHAVKKLGYAPHRSAASCVPALPSFSAD
ncbi:hypothetical protein QN224_31775 [Sinorhizobium sp. 8-89]|uniref:hypothetical protein n=1 Tax=Sinorhizobium sp. 7-81 TaxID=3049087 RepID=UPI0024C31AED|nr:hypothetical protein [Sinorhizobium sp. 7-81]MDK1389913.1 hypothetical protein [Sinorhizobium sp. 7-81]